MNHLQHQWATVTTATKPSHQYVTATTMLHASLSAVEREHLLPGAQVGFARPVDLDAALSDLRYTATDLAELTHAGAQLAEPLTRSRLLFAPARILPSTMERVHDRNHGRYVAIQFNEAAELIDAAHEGSSAARHVRSTLETSVQPAATTQMSAQPLAARITDGQREPAASLGGPDLF